MIFLISSALSACGTDTTFPDAMKNSVSPSFVRGVIASIFVRSMTVPAMVK